MSYRHYSRCSIILPVCEGTSSIKNPNFCSPRGAKRSVKIPLSETGEIFTYLFKICVKYANNLRVIYSTCYASSTIVYAIVGLTDKHALKKFSFKYHIATHILLRIRHMYKG